MVQKKKSDEQDVLVVRDEKTGEISVVAGLSRDGTPKRAPVQGAKPIRILPHSGRPGGKPAWRDEGVTERSGG